MPSLRHDALVTLLQNNPELAAKLVRDHLHVPLGEHPCVSVVPNELLQTVPPALHPDLVLKVQQGHYEARIVFEVQNRPNESKRRVWPEYGTRLFLDSGCDVYLVVVVSDEKTAKWAQTPIRSGNFTMEPMVLRLDQLPLLEDVHQAYKALELAVLSVMTHGHSPQGERVARATLEAIAQKMNEPHEAVDEDQWMFYYDLVLKSVNEIIRKELEQMLAGYEYQSDFARKYYFQGIARGEARGEAKGEARGKAEGIAEGEAKGEARGKAEGIAEGEAKGEARGKAEGEARALLTMFDARGWSLTDSEQQRIRSCTDLPTLEQWVRRAATASKASEVFPN